MSPATDLNLTLEECEALLLGWRLYNSFVHLVCTVYLYCLLTYQLYHFYQALTMNPNLTRIEKLLGGIGQRLVQGVKPSRKDILLQGELNKKNYQSYRFSIAKNRKLLLSQLKENFGSWGHHGYLINEDKDIIKGITLLLEGAKDAARPSAKKTKKESFTRTLDDLFSFYTEISSDSDADPRNDESYMTETTEDEDCSTSSSRNYKDISRFAMALEESEVSDVNGAKLANALLMDYGLLSPDNLQDIIDPQKVRRAREKVVNTLNEDFKTKIETEKPKCLFFDSKIIFTNSTREGKKKKLPIDTYVVCDEHENFIHTNVE